MLTSFKLRSYIIDINTFANSNTPDKFKKILSLTYDVQHIELGDEFIYQYQVDDIKNYLDMIVIYSLLECITGVKYELENIKEIITPIIKNNLLITNRFFHKNNNDIGNLENLPNLALFKIQEYIHS